MTQVQKVLNRLWWHQEFYLPVSDIEDVLPQARVLRPNVRHDWEHSSGFQRATRTVHCSLAWVIIGACWGENV